MTTKTQQVELALARVLNKLELQKQDKAKCCVCSNTNKEHLCQDCIKKGWKFQRRIRK